MWSGLTFLGAIAFRQPNYTGIESSISDCLSSGMKVIMMSDQPSDQATDVAYELGLIHDSNSVERRRIGQSWTNPNTIP